MTTRHGLVMLGAVWASGVALAGEPYGRAGWQAEITNGLHQVEAIATIVDEQTILVEHFTYDGTAPLVYFYLGGNDTHGAFLEGLQVPPLLDRPYADESLVLTLPPGQSLDDYTALSVWCAAFNVNFGSAVFRLVERSDADDDGDVDLDDYASFAGCMGGPNTAPGALTQQCLDAFDGDDDGDVDAADHARFQLVFTGPPAATATYELVFESTWSAVTHPLDFPPGPHFSGLVGGTHSAAASFWEPGGIASQGIENMAEFGSKTVHINEVNAAIAAGTAGEVISGDGIGVSPGSVAVSFIATQAHAQVTVTSMLAPSPDWFVGVHGYELFRDNQWTPQIVIRLDPYDAGTDAGASYTSSNQDITPHIPIEVINGYPFGGGPGQLPLGTFTFRRVN